MTPLKVHTTVKFDLLHQLQHPWSCAKLARVNTWCSGSFPKRTHWVIWTKRCSPWMSSAG